MNLIIKDDVKYLSYSYENESELEDFVKEYSDYIFGKNSLYLSKKNIQSKSGISTIPDAFVINLKEKKWYVVEVELSIHPIHRHIFAQISGFNTAINNDKTRKKLVKSFYKEIENDSILKFKFESLIKEEKFKFISEIIDESPEIIIIIDKKKDVVKEVCKTLTIPSKVLEFKTYFRENVGKKVSIHQFDSLIDYTSSSKTIIPHKNISSEKTKDLKSTKKKFQNKIVLDTSYSGKSISSFYFNGKNYEVHTWKNLLVQLIDILNSLNKNDFEKVLDVKGRKRPYFTYNKNELRVAHKIANTKIFVETNLSANHIVKICYTLLRLFEYSINEIKIETE